VAVAADAVIAAAPPGTCVSMRKDVLAGALATGLAGLVGGLYIGYDEPEPPPDNSAEVRRERIIHAVQQGQLPPVVLRMYPWTGEVDPSFIDGPGGFKDVVRLRGDEGPKLRWDLDEDGRISRDERTITEEELYVASLKYRDAYRP
jgi:hypothetical protein